MTSSQDLLYRRQMSNDMAKSIKNLVGTAHGDPILFGLAMCDRGNMVSKNVSMIKRRGV